MTDTILNSLVELLVVAVSQPQRRKECIETFQTTIWNSPCSTFDKAVEDILADLAYDLDYYEPDPRLRSEDPTFYGDDKAEEMIRAALTQLRELGVHIPTK